MGAVTGAGGERERAQCLGHLALVEALRGQLRRAAKLAAQATAACTADRQQPSAQYPNPAALVALAWMHTERHELREAHIRLKQADAALHESPDKLIGAVACLAAACIALADRRAAAAVQIIARARSGWSWPAWLGHRLSLAESRAHVMAGDIQAALAAAEQGGHGSPAAAVAIDTYGWPPETGTTQDAPSRPCLRSTSGTRTGAAASVARRRPAQLPQQ